MSSTASASSVAETVTTRRETAATGPGDSYEAVTDAGSLLSLTTAIGARRTWRTEDAWGRAVTGLGVGVAVLDSGVNAVPGLDSAGKVVVGPDLSAEAADPDVAGRDTAGHGTHLAGIIAAADAGARDARTGCPVTTDPAAQFGVAPDARLFAVKLSTADGTTDVGRIVDVLDWLAEHAGDPEVGVRVVTLAFGTESVERRYVDPLAAAARRAWKSGLVVVVSAGNDGNAAGMLTNPAIDPWVLAVGSSAPGGDGAGWDHPTVSEFSNGGSADRHVDLLAPGTSVTSLRNPGSNADVHHPEGRVAGDRSGRLFRGSGTSQAAAVVAGAAALLLQANPALTPDQVKAALMLTARPIAGVSPLLQGAGQIDVAAAVALAISLTGREGAGARVAPPAGVTPWLISEADDGDALGKFGDEASSRHPDVMSCDSERLAAVCSAKWTSAKWTSAKWTSAKWTSAKWTSAKWTSAKWTSAKWTSAKWTSAKWTSAKWTSAKWTSASWT